MKQPFYILLVAFLFTGCSSQLAKCQNNGIPLNSTTCKCPGFITGDLCEQAHCSRFGILDKNRCACPPGMYDKYCGHRGCRPMVENTLDFSKRSLIIVFNTKTSMRDQLTSLTAQLPFLYTQLNYNQNTNKTEDSIENIIIYGFVKKGNNFVDQINVLRTVDDARKVLAGLELSDGDEEQPVISAVVKAQQTIPQMKPRSIVLVFTDSLASDATPWSHYFPNNYPEQKAVYATVLWGNSLSFFLSVPSNSDLYKDGVDVYRRLAMSTNGDSFFGNIAKENILTNVMKNYHYAENIAAGYGVNGNQTIVPTPDNHGDFVFVLVTVDDPNASKLDIPDAIGMQLISSGSNHKLFSSRSIETITIIPNRSQTVFNFRVFIQSSNVVLLDFNSDELIDVGNAILRIGDAGLSTTRTLGFGQWDAMYWHVNTKDNGRVIHSESQAFLRDQLDCTYPYSYPRWADNGQCPPGPFTNIIKIRFGDETKTRVTPGYAIIVDMPKSSEVKVQEDTEYVESKCNPTNINAINDPRMNSAKQIIFILERHSGNGQVYQELSNTIAKIISNIDQSSTAFDYEFTLIIHCDKESRVLLSTYDPSVFTAKFPQYVHSTDLFDNLDNTMGLMSVVHAQKSIQQPVAQVFYFTNNAVKNVQNISRHWDIIDRNIEINFFSISNGNPQNVLHLPEQLELVRKMTNGRIIPIPMQNSRIDFIIANMIRVNGLTTDSRIDDCSQSIQKFEGFVENNSQNVLEIVGSDLTNIGIFDANGNTVPYNNAVSNNNHLIIANIDKNANFARGPWKINVQTSKGGCQVSVRTVSDSAVVLGFTNSSTTDIVLSQIPTQRAPNSDATLYVTAHLNNDNLIVKELQIESMTQPQSISNYPLSQRDSTCTYSYITQQISIPHYPLSKWTVIGYDKSNNIAMKRIFYYYQHYPEDTSVCKGNKVDEWGQCICPDGYSGEYCEVANCQNGGTPNYGICVCSMSHMGLFCESDADYGNSTTTTPTTPSNRTPTSPTTTTVPTTTKNTAISSQLSLAIAIALLLLL